MKKEKKHIVNFSGGKDSSAMLLRMIELDMPIDEIVFADTTLELPEMYEWMNYVEKFIKIRIHKLKPKYNFDEWFYGKFTKGKNKGRQRGFPLVFGKMCHLRGTFKVNQLTKIQKHNDYIYIGIAKDEEHRTNVKTYKNKKYKFPLIEWGWSEQDCMNYLKDNNFPFPFFNKKRTGCWLCPQQSLESLKTLMINYPKLWKKLKQYEKDSPQGFRTNGFKLQDFENKHKNQTKLDEVI